MISTVPTSSGKLGRNDPCPCGSGRKYKACCLNKAAPVEPSTSSPALAGALRRAWQAVAERDAANAARWFGEALRLQPDHAEALAGLGQALCRQERVREGLDHLRKAAEILERQAAKTRDIGPMMELAEQLHHWGALDTAVRLGETAVRLSPNSAVAQNNLALYLSRVNRVEEALPHARKACRMRPDDPASNNLLAILEMRQGRLAEARERFEAIVAANASPHQTARALQELAQLLDRQGEYDAAFEACRRGKALHRDLPEFRHMDFDHVFNYIATGKAGFDRALLRRWSPADFADGLPAPVFLIGFLRSGTTLTEQVLGAHPEVFTSDENSLMNGLLTELRRIAHCGFDTPAGLRRIGLDQARALRAYYWQRVREEYGPEALEKRFVDKVALNSIDVGCISTLFPEAKILFALRDPRDVVLSCFMQTFQPSAVTANLLSWKGVARQYAAVMDLWLYLRKDIAPEYLELRYEDTVGDFEGTFRRVFALLGLEWTPEAAAFHERAKGRYIATPSFAAVSQPIYRSSVARWRRYEKHYAEVLPILEPYLRAFGYSEHD